MIGIIATLTAQDGKADELVAICKGLAAEVNAKEDGCLQYDVFIAADDANKVTFIERYADQAALDLHGQTEYFKAAGPKFATVLGGAPDIKFLKEA